MRIIALVLALSAALAFAQSKEAPAQDPETEELRRVVTESSSSTVDLIRGLESHLAKLKAEGYRLINESPVPGAHGCRVAFLHPAAGNGVLIELSEKIK